MGYLGSKAASGAYQAIIAQMPPHDTYIESHLGGGAVMLRKPPAIRSIGVDIDDKTLKDFRQHHMLNKRNAHIELINHDAADFLNSFDYDNAGRTFIYADPPYLLETRTGRARYRHDYTRADHARLIAVLRSLHANIMISGYPSAFYDDLLHGWRSVEFQVMTRGGGGGPGKGKKGFKKKPKPR
ncbi:DNA adenine methylase [Edaphovirga cremea]|uniref:DNA adenine methylase n=1 Tax=Edaphovirga cremea TaxID=2267246 RepID=UPI003988B542